MTASALADCCPRCRIGDFPASLPHAVAPDPACASSLRADYDCGRGHRWTTWWDAASANWPRQESAA